MGCLKQSELHTCGKEPRYKEPVFDTSVFDTGQEGASAASVQQAVRQLLRDELRVKVDAEYSGPVIDSVTVSLWLHDEKIATHSSYLGWPEKKEHRI